MGAFRKFGTFLVWTVVSAFSLYVAYVLGILLWTSGYRSCLQLWSESQTSPDGVALTETVIAYCDDDPHLEVKVWLKISPQQEVFWSIFEAELDLAFASESPETLGKQAPRLEWQGNSVLRLHFPAALVVKSKPQESGAIEVRYIPTTSW